MRLALLALLALLAATSPAIADKADLPATPKPRPVQQPVAAACDVFEVWASHGKGDVDPTINKQLAKRLGASLKQNDFKLQSNKSVALTAKKAEAIKLSKGSATITLVETVNKTQLRLNVDFNAANKGNSKQTVLVAAGDYVIIGVNQSGDAKAEAHVLAVGNCK